MEQNKYGFRRFSQCFMVDEPSMDHDTSKALEEEDKFEWIDDQVFEPIGKSSFHETSATNSSSSASNTEKSFTTAIVLDEISEPNPFNLSIHYLRHNLIPVEVLFDVSSSDSKKKNSKKSTFRTKLKFLPKSMAKVYHSMRKKLLAAIS